MKTRVLLVCDSKRRGADVEQGLIDAGYVIAARLGGDDDVASLVEAARPDVLVMQVDVPGERMLGQVRKINEALPLPIVMFAGNRGGDATQEAVKAGVSAYIVNGFSVDRIKPIVDIAMTRFGEIQTLRRELERTRTALADRKLIDRAKGILMRQHGLPEHEAYKALRKLAMNQNQKMVEAARSVIAVSEMVAVR